MKYFSHPESECKWQQPDDAPFPEDGLSVELTKAQFKRCPYPEQPYVSPHVAARIAWQGELEFLSATEDDRTGRTVQFRIIRKLDEVGLAHPFSPFTRRRRGFAGTRFGASFVEIGTDKPGAGEIMLLNWADGPKGATVKFLLEMETGDHPFMNCNRRTADAAGTTFMVALVELDDDDAVINQAKRERYEKSQQKTSNVAAMMVKHPRFHEWLTEIEPMRVLPKAEGAPCDADGRPLWTSKLADEWLKEELGIDSKAELDGENLSAIRKFTKLRAKYQEWLEAHHYERE